MSRPAKNRLTCGNFGGRTTKGAPCGVAAIDGPCHLHRDEIAAVSAEHFNPGFKFLTPPFERTKDKVCIVGFTQHRDIATTLDRDEWEIWGLNELYRYMPPDMFDRWFEVHGREYLTNDEGGEKHIEDLKKFPIPVYMQKVHDDIPASVKFPKDELCRDLGSTYWTNCPAWMVGMAIAMEFKEIMVVGVDMAQDSEYYSQRTCIEHWLGYARGRGIEVSIPDLSDLLKSVGVYGYEDEGSVLSRKLEERLVYLHEQDNQRLELMRRLEADYEVKKAKLRTKIDMIKGAIEERTEFVQMVAKEGEEAPEDERAKELQTVVDRGEYGSLMMEREYTQKHGQIRDERNQLLGGIQDVNYIQRSWMTKADGINGGNIPDRAARASDPRTGILVESADGIPADKTEELIRDMSL